MNHKRRWAKEAGNMNGVLPVPKSEVALETVAVMAFVLFSRASAVLTSGHSARHTFNGGKGRRLDSIRALGLCELIDQFGQIADCRNFEQLAESEIHTKRVGD